MAPSDFLFEPEPHALLERLVPMYVEISVYRRLPGESGELLWSADDCNGCGDAKRERHDLQLHAHVQPSAPGGNHQRADGNHRRSRSPQSLSRSPVLFADTGAIPAPSVLAYRSRLRALAAGLAWSRRKSPGFSANATAMLSLWTSRPTNRTFPMGQPPAAALRRFLAVAA